MPASAIKAGSCCTDQGGCCRKKQAAIDRFVAGPDAASEGRGWLEAVVSKKIKFVKSFRIAMVSAAGNLEKFNKYFNSHTPCSSMNFTAGWLAFSGRKRYS
ncbi:MAG: hypothetical protein ACOC3F_01190 [Desulfosudaceae bacterium]